MATKLRLQRYGKKGHPYFHLVAADSRSSRDGKYIERLGSYDPTTIPATIDINFEKTLTWIKKGAQPTHTVRAILSYKGVMFKNHLDKGVLKGALTQEQADSRFEKWLKDKESKIEGHKESVNKKNEERKREAYKKEIEANAAREAKIAAKAKPVEEKSTHAEEKPADTEVKAEESPTQE